MAGFGAVNSSESMHGNQTARGFAMRSFDQLLGLLSNIPDPRRAEA